MTFLNYPTGAVALLLVLAWTFYFGNIYKEAIQAKVKAYRKEDNPKAIRKLMIGGYAVVAIVVSMIFYVLAIVVRDVYNYSDVIFNWKAGIAVVACLVGWALLFDSRFQRKIAKIKDRPKSQDEYDSAMISGIVVQFFKWVGLIYSIICLIVYVNAN